MSERDPWFGSIVVVYEGRPINKLQNGIILLFFKTWKIRNIDFVHNLIGHICWNLYEYDVIIMTSRVHRTLSVSAVFYPFFYHLVLNVIASYEYQKKRMRSAMKPV